MDDAAAPFIAAALSRHHGMQQYMSAVGLCASAVYTNYTKTQASAQTAALYSQRADTATQHELQYNLMSVTVIPLGAYNKLLPSVQAQQHKLQPIAAAVYD
eukprot:19183-Heterococcus_DN1.PRE.3